jgi:hypothetical protein
MGGKAKPTKHTAREIAKKTAEANTNKGGGSDGLKDRLGGPAGHSKYMCPICKAQVPDIKTLAIHYESKHPKDVFNEAELEDLHEQQGGTTKGVAVRGSCKK